MGRKKKFNEKEKWCPTCKAWLPLDAFNENVSEPSGRQCYCRECHKGKVAEEDKAAYQRQYVYGLSNEAYQAMLNKQNKECAICKRVVKLSVDHNHITKTVRGLLCTRCNTALGKFNDDCGLLEAAIYYLKSEFTPQI